MVKRASLMRSRAERRSTVVVGDEDLEDGFTQRVLMSLIVDVTCLAENVERVKVQVTALARANGVHVPKD